MAKVANRTAAGDLPDDLQLRAGDDSSLMAAMQRMVVTLRGLVQEMSTMASEHDAARPTNASRWSASRAPSATSPKASTPWSPVT